MKVFWPIPLQALAAIILLFVPTISPGADASRRAAEVEFSVQRGSRQKPFLLALTTSTRDARIVFTTNGTTPSATHGFSYESPFEVRATMLVRATAFREGLNPAPVATHSYLFLDEVAGQTGAGFPASWGTTNGIPVAAWYGLSQAVVGQPGARERMARALGALPVLSLVMDPADLFDAKRGIYANPLEHGADWERPASMEWIPVDGGSGIQADCGIRIQGGWNRRPEESPKHSFRLEFRRRYGPPRLRFKLFGPEGGASFDSLILRAGCNNTWLHWSGEERSRGEFIRDQWMRDSHQAMGHPAARGVFAHLFINGLYWGIYNPTERPDASFAASRLGGEAGDYEVRNGENILEGDDTAWRALMSAAGRGLADAANYAAVAELLDIPAFADFLLLNSYGANGDWDGSSNWYAARRRSPPGRFQFFVWDGERTLEGLNDNSLGYDADQSPPRLFQKLRENPEFRKTFAERARLHLGEGGALAPGAAARRYQEWANRLAPAIFAESARWGGYRSEFHRYKTPPYVVYQLEAHWQPEVARLVKGYFPARTGVLIEQLRAAGLWQAP